MVSAAASQEEGCGFDSGLGALRVYVGSLRFSPVQKHAKIQLNLSLFGPMAARTASSRNTNQQLLKDGWMDGCTHCMCLNVVFLM